MTSAKSSAFCLWFYPANVKRFLCLCYDFIPGISK